MSPSPRCSPALYYVNPIARTPPVIDRGLNRFLQHRYPGAFLQAGLQTAAGDVEAALDGAFGRALGLAHLADGAAVQVERRQRLTVETAQARQALANGRAGLGADQVLQRRLGLGGGVLQD